MAKRKYPLNQLPEYSELDNAMTAETASILSDYIRQYVGIASATPQPGSGIFLNTQDRVIRSQVYQELAWYDLYDEVEKDPHVSSILGSARMNVACLDWNIIPHGTGDESTNHSVSSRDKAIADFVAECFAGLENFTQDLYELMDALGKGFSCSEIIWKVGADVRLERLMHRPQRRIQFDAITREPKLRTLAQPYFGEPLPERKFIIHRCSSKYENPFGDAIDQSLYWMWLFKKMVLKFWLGNLEIGTAPIPYVKHPRGATKEMKDEALAVARQLRQGAYGRVPDNFELLFAEATGGGNMSFEQFVRFCDDQMTKCVNGQILTSEASGSGGNGSRALGDVHEKTQSQRDAYRAKGLEATINSTLVKWLVDYNFSNVDGYPRFTFDTEEAADLERESRIIGNLSSAGYQIDEEEISKKFGYTITRKPQPAIDSKKDATNDTEAETNDETTDTELINEEQK